MTHPRSTEHDELIQDLRRSRFFGCSTNGCQTDAPKCDRCVLLQRVITALLAVPPEGVRPQGIVNCTRDPNTCKCKYCDFPKCLREAAEGAQGWRAKALGEAAQIVDQRIAWYEHCDFPADDLKQIASDIRNRALVADPPAREET